MVHIRHPVDIFLNSFYRGNGYRRYRLVFGFKASECAECSRIPTNSCPETRQTLFYLQAICFVPSVRFGFPRDDVDASSRVVGMEHVRSQNGCLYDCSWPASGGAQTSDADSIRIEN
jgi:hypothetical protein